MKFGLVIILILFFGCNSETQTKLNTTEIKTLNFDTTYNKIEFYCYCMGEQYINGRAVLVSVCGEKDEVAPNKLISKEHYYDSIDNKERIDKFSKLFFNHTRKIIEQSTYPNARFAFLLKSKTNKTDTVFWNINRVTHDTAVLNLNQKYLIVYPFNIMDSIRHLLGRKAISCDFLNESMN
jgi:hypothetical protein